LARSGAIRILAFWLAISAAVQAQQYVFRAFRQAEGLKNLAINDLAADHHGFLWVATGNGVYRFLGYGFERYGPEQGIGELNVRAVLVAPDDTVWAATQANLYHWDGRRFVAAGRSPISIASWNRVAIEDAHHLLIVEGEHLYRLEHDDQNHMISFLPVFSVSEIADLPELAQVSSVSVVHDAATGVQVAGHRVPSVQIWIGCRKGLCSWTEPETAGGVRPPPGKIVEWGEKQGLASLQWESVLLDHAGTLWARGKDRVSVLPRHAARFVDRSVPGTGGISVGGDGPLIEDREGRVLGPLADGIARWDGGQWRTIGKANGLPLSGNVVRMVLDAVGDPWIATRGDGLFDWVGYEDWEGWNDTAALASADVWTIVPSSDRVYLGTDKGPAWVDQRTGNAGSLNSLRPWTFGPLYTMGANQDGTLWGGTKSASVLVTDPKTGKTTQVATLPALITRSIGDHAGHVFFTTNQGIYTREAGNTMSVPQLEKGAVPLLGPMHQVNAACESPDGAVWFMTTNRLLRLQNGHWTVPEIHGEHWPKGVLLDLACAADGSVWITGEQTGTWRIKPGMDGWYSWQLKLPAELQAETPVAIAADRRGWIWLGTDAGVVVWNGQEWRQLTQESGLIWNDVNQGAMTVAADGSMWIGTSDGIAHLLHPERAFVAVPLNVEVTSIRRGEETYTVATGIELPWSQLPLTFQLSSPAMRNRSQLAFEYRMGGSQSDWIESQNGVAVFSGLSPGKYRFSARVRNLGLNSISSTINIEVKILPPWWKTWWFLTFCGLAIFIVVVGADRLRERELLERSRELEFQVKKRTVELEDRVTEVRVAEEQIKKLAFYDPLTLLPNRRLLAERLTQILDAGTKSNVMGALLFIDIDNFKTLNDTLGHATGDLLLREVAMRLSASVREGDLVARLGGDEFVVILAELSQHPETAAAKARMVAEKILDVICRTYRINGRECHCTSSIGITVIGEHPDTNDDVLQRADIAMYQAKQNGGQTMHFFDPVLRDAMNARATMEADMRQAITASEFALFYQPQLEAGRLVGAEALIRWNHPRRGFLGPGAFITLAEETGLILPLGDWVLESACRQIAAWAKQERTEHLTVAVNISARQLREADFVSRVMTALERTGANPMRLKLELTESMLVDNIESVIAKMTEIKAVGIGFSLDDFGTGYSSLSYLKRLPLDQLKIDRSFVRDIVEDLSSRAIAQSVISLGHVMNRSVIAEGVETEAQLDCLTGLGCHAFQGFLFGWPLPIEDFELLMPVFSDLHTQDSAYELSLKLGLAPHAQLAAPINPTR
jgi:diguanylate cyclase (GGDEF)-like protein